MERQLALIAAAKSGLFPPGSGSVTESVMGRGRQQVVGQRMPGDLQQLDAGEEGRRVCKDADLTEIPVHVLQLNGQQVFAAAHVENIQRADLSPIEKALGFKD